MSYTRLKRKKRKNVIVKKRALFNIKIFNNSYGKCDFTKQVKNDLFYKNNSIIKSIKL